MSFVVDVTGDRELIEAIDNQIISIEQVQKKIIIEFFKRIILKTPVKTGQARSNWQCSISAPESGTTENTNSNIAIIKMTDIVLGASNEDITYFLTNNLPYIERLENGWSDQAPQGMIKTTIAEFDGIIREFLNEL